MIVVPQENLKTNFYITSPNKFNIEQVEKLYKQNRDTLGIPFNRIFSEMLEDKNFLVMEDENGYVVGFCGFKYKKKYGYYEIEHLCVDPKFRNKHVAMTLLQFQILLHYNNGVNKLFLAPAVVAYAVDGADNNSFYDKISVRYDIVPKKTKVLRRYWLDVDRIRNYGS